MSQWIVETLIATSLLMLGVLVLRAPVARWFGPRIAYLLWLAPALRMILPPLPEQWFEGAAAAPVAAPMSEAALLVTDTPLTPVIAETAGGGTAWLATSLMVWLGGALVFFGWHGFRYWQFSKGALAEGEEMDHDLPVRLVASPTVSSPVALGIFGRKVIVPADFEARYDAIEQRLALSHEVTHHQRGDLTVNFAALAMLSAHWFNPIAHLAHKAFRLDQEAACDAIVLAGATREERHAYGTALFKSATGGVPLAACAMGLRTTLKQRLRQIASGEKGVRVVRFGLIGTLSLIVIGLGLTATRGIAESAQGTFEPGGTLIEKSAIAALTPESAQDIDRAEAKADAAERAADQAERRAEIAQEQAEAAREKAESRREQQGDAATEASIASAEAAAEKARDAAEKAQEAAYEAMREANEATEEAARNVEAAMADIDRATREAAEAANETTRARHQVHAVNQACKNAASRSVTAENVNGHQIVLVQCDAAIKAYTNARTIEALEAARKRIRAMRQLTTAQRQAALDGLSSAMRELAPLPPLPPAPRVSSPAPPAPPVAPRQ
jgi:bla regulator protein blaR1